MTFEHFVNFWVIPRNSKRTGIHAIFTTGTLGGVNNHGPFIILLDCSGRASSNACRIITVPTLALDKDPFEAVTG